MCIDIPPAFLDATFATTRSMIRGRARTNGDMMIGDFAGTLLVGAGCIGVLGAGGVGGYQLGKRAEHAPDPEARMSTLNGLSTAAMIGGAAVAPAAALGSFSELAASTENVSAAKSEMRFSSSKVLAAVAGVAALTGLFGLGASFGTHAGEYSWNPS